LRFGRGSTDHHHHFILPKSKNIIFNNTVEIQLAGRQKNIKFMKLAPMLYTILNIYIYNFIHHQMIEKKKIIKYKQ